MKYEFTQHIHVFKVCHLISLWPESYKACLGLKGHIVRQQNISIGLSKKSLCAGTSEYASTNRSVCVADEIKHEKNYL